MSGYCLVKLFSDFTLTHLFVSQNCYRLLFETTVQVCLTQQSHCSASLLEEFSRFTHPVGFLVVGLKRSLTTMWAYSSQQLSQTFEAVSRKPLHKNHQMRSAQSCLQMS